MTKRNKKPKSKFAAVKAHGQQSGVFNWKLEQLVRALYLGFNADMNLTPNIQSVPLMVYYAPDAHIEVGYADEYGIRFTGSTNSTLAAMGYHSKALLYHLSRMTHDGAPVLVSKDGKLLVLHAAAVQACRDMLFNYEQVHVGAKGLPEKDKKGRPLVRKVWLARYKRDIKADTNHLLT